MYVTIDRFEGDYAVLELENRDLFQVLRSEVEPAVEGDVLLMEQTKDGIKFILDTSETTKRRKKIDSLMDKLFHD
jgi:hypothetical protein